MPTADDQHALADVRVLDLTGTVAGSVAGMLLADLGADVVKVHPPGTVPLAGQPGRATWDRGKRAVTADPASAEDLRVLDRLIAAADVLLAGTDGPGITYRDLTGRGHLPGAPGFWVVMPPYLLNETPWPGGRECDPPHRADHLDLAVLRRPCPAARFAQFGRCSVPPLLSSAVCPAPPLPHPRSFPAGQATVG